MKMSHSKYFQYELLSNTYAQEWMLKGGEVAELLQMCPFYFAKIACSKPSNAVDWYVVVLATKNLIAEYLPKMQAEEMQ